MALIFWLEIKKHLLAYKRVLCWLAAAAVTGAVLYAGALTLLERDSYFEPFTIGVVDNAGSPEVQFIFDFFNETLDLAYLTKAEAEAKLAAGEIPAYVELPERFAHDIITGANTPFRLYGNRGKPLQLALAKLLAAGGVAFLSSAQAGVYATLDYAAENGLPRAFTDTYILLPINVAFVKKWLEYENFFSPQRLPIAGGQNPAAFYSQTFAAFLWMCGLFSFMETLRGYTAGVYARCRLAGRPLAAIWGIRLAGLAAVLTALAVPLYVWAALGTGWFSWGEAAARAAALSVCAAAFGLMTAALFRGSAGWAGGLFIFGTALGMLFFAGGTVPLAYLPPALHFLRFFSVPYWAAAGGFTGAAALWLMALIFSGVGYSAELFYSRVPRAV